MRGYIARQLVQLVVVIIGISILSFAILHVIGDPVLLLLPQNAGKEEYDRYRALFGLDQPLVVQYWKFASRAVRGRLRPVVVRGHARPSARHGADAAHALPDLRGPRGGPPDRAAPGDPGRPEAPLRLDNLCTMVAVAGQAMPIFWLGIMLIIIFAVRLQALPASGYGTWQHFVMPAFCLGAFLAPITMRLVRSGIIEVMNMEYIKTARAKGVAEALVVAKHAFRNACIPVLTVLGLQFGQLLGGAIVTETVFAWPGVATLTVDSIRNQDFPVVQCAVVLLALVIVVVNLAVDVLVGFIDPRIRVQT